LHEKRTQTSARAAEIYENQFLDSEDGQGDAIWWRGGGGVAFNNTVSGYKTFAYLVENAEYQNETFQPHDIWIWNNNIPSDCTLVEVYGDIQQNRDYFLYAPSWYTPYPYPHPLTLGGENYHYFDWNSKDLNGNNVESLISWSLWKGTQQLTYYKGYRTLPDGTYTLKIYYLGYLINTTTLNTAVHGDKTITLTLPMIAHSSVSGGYIAFNKTISSITIHSQTPTNLTFTATGSGAYTIVIKVPSCPTTVKKDSVIQPYGSIWTYNSNTGAVVIQSTLSTWQIDWNPPPAPAPAPTPTPTTPTPTPTPQPTITPPTIPIWLILPIVACIAIIAYIFIKKH
jgi:hypothetical protein